jgi:hypothetical protein
MMNSPSGVKAGAVDQRDDLGAPDGRHARDRLLHQVAQPLPVGRQELVREVAWDPVEAPGHGRALVAAHQEPADFLAEIDEAVGVAHRRDVARHAVDRLGDEILVRHRDHRNGEADHPADLVRPDPGRVDDRLARHRPLLRLDTGDPATGDPNAEHVHAGPDRDAALSRPRRERPGQRRRVDPAVGRQVRGALDPRDAHQRKQRAPPPPRSG